MNNAKTNTTKAEEATTIFQKMAKAVFMAHKANNAKAISKDFAAGCGVGDVTYGSWVRWIDGLYEAAAPWGQKFNDKKVTNEELTKIYAEIFPIWRKLVTVGQTEIGGHKNLFVRESDVARICSLTIKHGKTDNGSVDVIVGKTVFRREIETLLGIRLAQNNAMTDADYELVSKYDKAVKNKTKAENRLEGYERDGKKVEGLKETLSKVEKVYEDMKTILISAKMEADNPLIAGYKKAVDDVKSQITQAEKQISGADDYIKKNKKEYTAIMAKIKPIEE